MTGVAGTAAPPALAGVGLACLRGDRLVFADLSFALHAGEALILTGANGSGKSSLIRMIAGLLPPFDGHLLADGRLVQEDPAAHRALLAYVGHQDALKLSLTVGDNLGFWATMAGRGATGRHSVDEALAAWDLGRLSDLPARYLSAGQRRRLALARLLVAPRRLWLLDEPTVALDRSSIAILGDLLARHRAAGGMAVMATHADLPVGDGRLLSLDDHAPPPAAGMSAP
ncbi:MAG: heme ABC exporter ATP-binding protein CcmA [Rhodospirillaceae bacterium]|nr:heme ABC exporter ATP-binding protein CcmA [Rhodospirillaceae bacterium]